MLKRLVCVAAGKAISLLELTARRVDDDVVKSFAEAWDIEQPTSKVTERHEESPLFSANAKQSFARRPAPASNLWASNQYRPRRVR